mmetsp:Transcript_851/g.2480  ORF Transcript_851/g.2480 Transcript_851/m.2480 type:complete len:307 (+) Transcript_851:54-974(+)
MTLSVVEASLPSEQWLLYNSSIEPAYLSWSIPTVSRWVAVQDGAAVDEHVPEVPRPGEGCSLSGTASQSDGFCISASSTVKCDRAKWRQEPEVTLLPGLQTPLRSKSCQAFEIFTATKSPQVRARSLSTSQKSAHSPPVLAGDLTWTDDEWGASPRCWKGSSLVDLMLEASPSTEVRSASCESLSHSDIEAALQSMPTPQRNRYSTEHDEENCPSHATIRCGDNTPPRVKRPPRRLDSPGQAVESTPISFSLARRRATTTGLPAARDKFKADVDAASRSNEFHSSVLRELNHLSASPWAQAGVRMV